MGDVIQNIGSNSVMKSYINVCSRIYFDPSTPRNMHSDIYIKTLQGHKTEVTL